ncbi:hypothetical protein VTN00DRAFT_6068 [Thermoascus crustaceus]|uniref:uncharacterized protein n=1 Tax=Thermoascus crustaceus TaxID=5088 RepID=UPI003742D274
MSQYKPKATARNSTSRVVCFPSRVENVGNTRTFQRFPTGLQVLYPSCTLVELVEYPLKGVGVRSVSKFNEGDVLDFFVGELRPLDYEGDPTYALRLRAKREERALICPKRYGNWTRFTNHSCGPSTRFCSRTIGGKVVMIVEAIRDIGLFEDITVDYGPEYFKNTGRMCYCFEHECNYRKDT